MASERSVILDTCALLWLATGNKRLSRPTLKRIDEARAVYVSAVSGFEIAIKAAKGKISLPLPTQEWFEKALAHHGISVLPLDLPTCIAAAELPKINNDSCDRLLLRRPNFAGCLWSQRTSVFKDHGLNVFE